MKKLLTLAMIMLWVLSSPVWVMEARGEGGQRDEELLSYENSTDGAQYIVPATEGYICDIVEADGWILYNGRYDGGNMPNDLFALTGAGDDPVLLEEGIVGIVPCGDAIVYYGTGTDGEAHWLVRKPGEDPRVLPVSWTGSIFYGDENGLLYTIFLENDTQAIFYIGLDGKHARRVGTVEGYVFGVLSDGSIILANNDFNKVLAWKNGKTTTLYESPVGESFRLIETTREEIWVVYGDSYGRIENGALCDRQQGIVRGTARSGLQVALLVTEQMDTEDCWVVLVNDVVGSYANLGSAPYSGLSTSLMLQTDCVIVLGEVDTKLPIPSEASAWTVYGH